MRAFVKDKQTGERKMVEHDYTDKLKFAKDLRANGYAVIRVYNEKDWYAIEHSDFCTGWADMVKYHFLGNKEEAEKAYQDHLRYKKG